MDFAAVDGGGGGGGGDDGVAAAMVVELAAQHACDPELEVSDPHEVANDQDLTGMSQDQNDWKTDSGESEEEDEDEEGFSEDGDKSRMVFSGSEDDGEYALGLIMRLQAERVEAERVEAERDAAFEERMSRLSTIIAAAKAAAAKAAAALDDVSFWRGYRAEAEREAEEEDEEEDEVEVEVEVEDISAADLEALAEGDLQQVLMAQAPDPDHASASFVGPIATAADVLAAQAGRHVNSPAAAVLRKRPRPDTLSENARGKQRCAIPMLPAWWINPQLGCSKCRWSVNGCAQCRR